MNEKRLKASLILGANVAVVGLCVLAVIGVSGAGLLFWTVNGGAADAPSPEPTRRIRELAALPTPPPDTPTATPSPTPSPTASPTASPAPPTNTPPPTSTPPPTATPTPPPTATPAPPTPTPPPTDTPTPEPPAHAFEIDETARFETTNPGFDVFVAIVDDDNRPLRDYRVIGAHSGGMQVESPPSAGDWTENSGAMHYKAGNIKYQVPNSPTGVWTLQLVDQVGMPAAPPVEFAFDANSPSWYFLIYQRKE